MRAEFAGLLPTQKPGSVSNIPTVIEPPVVGTGFGVDDELLQPLIPSTKAKVAASESCLRNGDLMIRSFIPMLFIFFPNVSLGTTVSETSVSKVKNYY
jgi:hypothetical protein